MKENRKEFLIQSKPATKLLPYGFADIIFLCQWYEKHDFLLLTGKSPVSDCLNSSLTGKVPVKQYFNDTDR